MSLLIYNLFVSLIIAVFVVAKLEFAGFSSLIINLIFLGFGLLV